jgi:hypothetical protein
VLTAHIRKNAIDGLVHRLSPDVAEIVRQDLIQSVGNALRMQQRQGQAALQSIAFLLRHQLDLKIEEEKLDQFIQSEAAAEWGAW